MGGLPWKATVYKPKKWGTIEGIGINGSKQRRTELYLIHTKFINIGESTWDFGFEVPAQTFGIGFNHFIDWLTCVISGHLFAVNLV